MPSLHNVESPPPGSRTNDGAPHIAAADQVAGDISNDEPLHGVTGPHETGSDADPPAEAGRSAARGKRRSARGVILVAEDDPAVRLVMCRVLERAGYTVLSATSGEEALALSRATETPIAALVTDMVMPGMSGAELSRRIRRERPETRVLHVSGFMPSALRIHDALDGGNTLLQKPFSPHELLTRLAELLS